MKKKSKLIIMLIMAMLIQLVPMNVFASEQTETLATKTGRLPLEIEEVEITDEDVADAYTLVEQTKEASNYGTAWSDYESRYYYDLMSQEKKALYDGMYNQCMQYLTTQKDAKSYSSSYGLTEYIEYTGLSNDDLTEVVYLFTISNPQFYFVRGTAAATGSAGGRYYVALAIYADYSSGAARASYTSQFVNKVNNWINIINTETSDYKKLKSAHDIVCANIMYDYNGDMSRHQSSATAVLEGKTVCAGYAQLYSLLCNAAGIKTICVTSLEHEWNQVYLYGNWYVVDCTWDDLDSSNSWDYVYFCKSENAINEGYHNPEAYLAAYRPGCYSDYIGRISSYNGYTFYREEDEKIRCYDRNGKMVTNQFMFDGSYTYYMQADGSAMTDRLTYHPDGVHIIYFDSYGHEVFNAFQYCPSVGYTCYFDSQGYLYKDVITFYNNAVYYLNANGKMENEGWFQFANGMDYGYANWDGTLNTGGFSYDPWGRIVFYHWNGMVARGLITDGVYYYSMDMTDGHYLGSFPVN